MKMYAIISFAAAGGFLVPCTISDIRKKSIPALLAAGGPLCAAVWMLFQIVQEKLNWAILPAAGIPGVLIIVLSFLSGGQIGRGDGMVLLGLGFLLGCRETFMILLVSLLLSSLWSAFLLLRKKAGRGARIPWMPFLLAGYLVAVVWNICSTLR